MAAEDTGLELSPGHPLPAPSPVPAVFGVNRALPSASPWHCSPGVPRHRAQQAADTGGSLGVTGCHPLLSALPGTGTGGTTTAGLVAGDKRLPP